MTSSTDAHVPGVHVARHDAVELGAVANLSACPGGGDRLGTGFVAAALHEDLVVEWGDLFERAQLDASIVGKRALGALREIGHLRVGHVVVDRLELLIDETRSTVSAVLAAARNQPNERPK